MLAFLLLLAVPVFSQFPDGIELTSLDVEVESKYRTNVSGSIVNNGPHTIENPVFGITFRKDGIITAYYYALIKPSTLRSSVTGRFDVAVPTVEFDEYTHRIAGKYEPIPDYFTDIDVEDIPGSIDIVEGSQNVTPWYLDGYIVFYGEIINNTPAFFNYVTVDITVYNTNDVILLERYVNVHYLHPGEKATYHLSTDEVFLEDLGRYEVALKADRSYLLPTVVESKSWGEVKTIEKGK